jgi:hypothetical protein
MPELTVRFTEQQLVLLRQMTEETGQDRPMEELTREMFRDYARQMLGREYRKP